MNTILLIEDDETISMSITYLLNQEGFKTTPSLNITNSKEILKNNKFSLILLDISLPDGNGFDMCTYIKKNYDTPVIIITAKDEETNIVQGFDLGADDYITKPFRSRELISRIKNVLKRNKQEDSDIITISNVRIDIKNYTVFKDEKAVELTPLEYKLLSILFQNKGIILTREQILSSIWNSNDDYVNDNTLTVYIKRLREKIEKNPNEPKIIKTIRGIGYKVGDDK